jgi:precorrin-6Y C5,15-methyltransferase (decarboxylating)
VGKIYVIGTGPGSKDFVTPAAEEAAKGADILIGGKNALSLFPNEKPKKTIGSDTDEAINYIAQNRNQNIAILTSGDPGFYSILRLVTKNFPKEDIEVIPGISSIQLCFARLKECWHDAKFISLHGRGMDNISFAGVGKFVILTDKSSTPDKVARHLLERGLDGTAWVCDSLCQSPEIVLELGLKEISRREFSGNCVMVITPNQTKKWEYRSPGIPDELFKKGKSPMTKEEIRAITLSKARIKKDSVVYDIGSETGSITIEATLLANEGRVFSIEKNLDRCRTIRENIREFKVLNVEVIEGEAPRVMRPLPIADRIIIGGSGGKIGKILEGCVEKLDQEGIVVINAIKSETVREATAALRDLDFNFCLTRVSIRRVKGQRTEDLNPISVIDARR